ncbi:MAG: YggS family pyridoxal phosphate-dependent enzyme [Verrucomicrobiota bacterium]|jgi:pyridoxal phosphate enzyme (YggS family)
MDLAANLQSVRQRVAAACRRSARDPAAVALLAVSKGHPPETVAAAAGLGLSLFGESRVQEAKTKIPQCPGRLRWQMIGHLQSNKCRDAVSLFSMIQSVDSLPLAAEIAKWTGHFAKTMPVLLEINVAGESSKFGCPPENLLADIRRFNALPRIEIHGLMTVAPFAPDPEKVRPIFRRLRDLKEQCESILGAPLPHLSMGMSGDFEVAIEEGATIIRLGGALFGPRGRAGLPPGRGEGGA